MLPHLMRTLRGIPHSATKETPNYMMLGRELRLPDQLQHGSSVESFQSTNEYAIAIQDRLLQAHEILRHRQLEIVAEDTTEPPLFKAGDLVWMPRRRRRKGENSKLSAKRVGPYRVIQSFPNHTYTIERRGQRSVQSEHRLRAYKPCSNYHGKAPVLLEPSRRPNMRGVRKNNGKTQAEPVLEAENAEKANRKDNSEGGDGTTPKEAFDNPESQPSSGQCRGTENCTPASAEAGESAVHRQPDNVSRPQRSRNLPPHLREYELNSIQLNNSGAITSSAAASLKCAAMPQSFSQHQPQISVRTVSVRPERLEISILRKSMSAADRLRLEAQQLRWTTAYLEKLADQQEASP